ncbi:MAG TPA: hypothetical protein VMT64_09105 [Candidatus Binataceae bacterium]|nr:hypothetical protein [Candidatus Binataceae bacterium]
MLFGRIPLEHLHDYYVGRDTDPSLYMWSLAWWPYVLQHHVHPFFTKLIWAPYGLNLAWVTCLPLLGFLAMPVTIALGPLATFNLIMLILPPIAAISAFLLCRRLSNSFIAALLGGFLFGFSPYVLGQFLSHLNQLLIFPLPLAIYLGVRRYQADLSRIRFIILLTLVLSMQFLLVLEPFAMMTFVAGVTLLVALRLVTSDQRRYLLRLISEISFAYFLTAVLMSPYIYFYFAYGYPKVPLWPSAMFSADLLNFIVPTTADAIGNLPLLQKVSRNFSGNIFEQGGCLGIPLLIIAVLWMRRHRGELRTKLLRITIAVSCILAVGPLLQIAGRPVLPMPWLIIEKLPLLKSAIPARLIASAFLALAIIFTMWFSDPMTGAREKIIGTFAALLMMMPNPAASFWATRAPLPPFFRDGSVNRLLTRDDVVLPLPFGPSGMAMMWQAESGMNFRTASGLTGLQPIAIRRWPVLNALGGSRDLPEPELQLKAFLANLGITTIIIDASDQRAAQWERMLASLNIAPLMIAGVIFYRIDPDALKSYRGTTAIELEQRAERARFEALIAATDQYVARGGDLAKLNVTTLQAAGLFPPDWSFETKPDSYRDVWAGALGNKIGLGVIGSASGLRPTLDRYGSEAGGIYYPYPRPWSAEANHRGGFADLLAPTIWSPTSGDGEYLQLMVMEFDPPQLRQLAARVAAQSSLSLATAPRAVAR